MVVTIDLVDSNIHPANKFDVGCRLANWALAKEYKQEIPYTGPIFSKAVITGSLVTVEFDSAESGLMAAMKAGLESPVEQSDAVDGIRNFEITADGEAWHPANAMIQGKSVIISCPNVETPIAVRYAYSPAPGKCNLYNRDGLPASPFCSRPELLRYTSNAPPIGKAR